MTHAPGDAPHRAAAGGQAHDPGLHGARDRADEDHDAGRDHRPTPTCCSQANEVAQKTFRPLEIFTVDGADLLRRHLRVRACSCTPARAAPRRQRRSDGALMGALYRWDFALGPRQPRRAAGAGALGTLRIFAICLVLGLRPRPGRRPRPLLARSRGSTAGDGLRRVLPQHAGAGADPLVLLRAADPAAVPDQPAGGGVARHLAQLGGVLGRDLSAAASSRSTAASGTARARSA